MTRRMTKPARFGRRHVLRGVVAGMIGLPWLETFALRSAKALPASATPRFVVMFSANGTVQNAWGGEGMESDFTLSPILSPLAAHQSDLIVIEGVDQQGSGGDGHQTGFGGMLTGAGLLPGRFAGVGAPPAGWSEGPSIDQHIADALPRTTPYRSIELGVQTGVADNFGRMCYRGRNQPLAPREDPRQVFDDLFGPATLSAEERADRLQRRTSILDYVGADLNALADELSAADRERLQAHVSMLRELEQRLQAQDEILAACTVPSRPEATLEGNDAFPVIGELQLDLLVRALACGLTRVGSMQWSRSVSQVRFTWLDIAESHHELSHRPDADVAAQADLTRINAWYAERFAALIGKLKAEPEGEGTLFDSCLLFWCNELGKGNTHSRQNAPYVLAGSAGGVLSTGRRLTFPGDVPHNNLLLSLANAMGLPDTSFGRSEWCTGPLAGLL